MSTKTASFVFRLFSVLMLLTLLVSALGVTPAHAAGIVRYAKPNGLTSGSCNTWITACTLQTALTGAASGDEIWVMAGTHKPTAGSDRMATFQLKDGVALYGGFAGTETLRTERNPADSVTILSGDIDNNDSQTPIITDISTVTGNGTNSNHVVAGASGAILDGFTITAGFANSSSPHNRGGGVHNLANSSPTLTNLIFSGNAGVFGGAMYNSSGSSSILTDVTFSGNAAAGGGGGIFNDASSPTLTDVTFNNNLAGSYGGGMYNQDSSSPTLTNVTFSDNEATGATSTGGGMYNSGSSPTLTDVTFSANSAFNGGGMYNTSESNPTLTDVTFDANSADNGGGMYNSGSSPTLTDVTFSANSAAADGGGMYNVAGSSPALTDVTFNGNGATGSGGGMYNTAGSNPTLKNITFSANSAQYGGGMDNESSSSPILTNVTFSANPASFGGGVSNKFGSSPTLTNVTFSLNTATSHGGGMWNYESSNPQIRNTIFWGNTAGNTGPTIFNFNSTSSSVSNSVLEFGQFGCPTGSTCTNIITTDPLLGALGNYGGFTQTIPLQVGSSAIDTGIDAPTCPATDQRGAARPQGAHCDIGAYELVETIAPIVTTIIRLNPSPTNLASVDFTVTFSESVNGVDMTGPTFDDFALTTSPSVSGASVSGVSGSGTTYTVTVNTGSGNGTLRLDVGTGGAIVDAALNPLATGFTAGEIYSVIKTATFADVPLDYWANSYIERLYNAGVTGGCSVTPLNYCPDSTVTRAQMAVFLLKGMHGSSYAPPAVGADSGFSDVPVDYWAAAWIKQLAAEGITGGCGTGIYCPDATVTRAQMAVFLLKAEHGLSYSPPAATGVFTDVPVGYWADKWIEQLAAEGITGGCGAGIYCPDAAVTRAQMAVFLVKAFNLP